MGTATREDRGHHLVAGHLLEAVGPDVFHAYDPRSGRSLEPAFADADPDTIDRALAAASDAVRELAANGQRRTALLNDIAERLEADADAIIATADEETALGETRLRGELTRTCAQLRLFGEIVRDGGYLDVIIDHADPTATPPRPDLRRTVLPVGPVVVFAASNFPLAFSVAGGDSASALAAGCPVVVKAHPAHPTTADRVGRHVMAAVEDVGLPGGAFSLIHGAQNETGGALVTHPSTRAVGFTGSTGGGRALYDIAASRPRPIPVYAEMGSINPVVVMPSAAERRPTEIGEALAASLLQGAGQFCTKPGLLFVPEGSSGDRVVAAIQAVVAAWEPAPLLAERICSSIAAKVGATAEALNVEPVSGKSEDGWYHPANLFQTNVPGLLRRATQLLEEHFGPAGIVVRYESLDELTGVWLEIGGTLTATIHRGDSDERGLPELVRDLAGIAGRVLFDGVPTGVAVTHAMHHGGPYPATTDGMHTSVGSTAIRRFLRPVVYQDMPSELLPVPLRDDNPLGVPQMIDGIRG